MSQLIEDFLTKQLNRNWQAPAKPEPESTEPPKDAIVIGTVRDLPKAILELDKGDDKQSPPPSSSATSSPAWLVPDDLSVHALAIGMSGSGKSTARDTILAEKFRRGDACIAICQNKDELKQLLRVLATTRSPEEVRAKKNVLIIDLEGKYTVALNPLVGDPESCAMRASSSVEKFWDSGVQVSRSLRAAFKTAATAGLTVAEIPLIFEHEGLCRSLLPQLEHQERSYWEGILTSKTANATADTVVYRLANWISFSPIRRMLSLPDSLSWRKLFQDVPDLVVLINLGTNVYADAGLAVGTLLLDSILFQLMSESRDSDDATPVFLVIDEIQGFITDTSVASLTDILCRARKYRLSLFLLTQLLDLLPSPLRSTIRTNTRTSLIFSPGAGARDMVDDINFKDSHVTREVVRQLVAHQTVGEAVLATRGKTSRLIHTTPPDPAFKEVTPEAIEALYLAGSETYGIPASEADRIAEERRNYLLNPPLPHGGAETSEIKVRRQGKEKAK